MDVQDHGSGFHGDLEIKQGWESEHLNINCIDEESGCVTHTIKYPE